MASRNTRVQTQVEQETPATKLPPATFERIEEYKVVVDALAQLGSRRLTTNAVFVGFNTLFLAAIASLLFSAHFDSWWLIAKVAIIFLVITPVNITWIRMLIAYRIQIVERYNYIKTIEQEFQRRRQEPNDEIGLWSKLYPNPVLPSSNVPTKQGQGTKPHYTSSELALAWYFTLLYPLISLGVAATIYLVTNGFIPPAP